MKTLNVILLCSGIFLSATHVCLSNEYLRAMQNGIKAVYSASDIPALQRAVNTLERIGEAEKMKWEPWYYAAFGYLMMANMEEDAVKKDAYLDLAMTSVEKAAALKPDESEIVALVGFVHMIRVSVDPESRGPEHAPRAMRAFQKANALNPENPRPLALMARMQSGTARFFGTPATEACALAAQSLQKFATYASDNALAPVWGKPMAEGVIQQCK